MYCHGKDSCDTMFIISLAAVWISTVYHQSLSPGKIRWLSQLSQIIKPKLHTNLFRILILLEGNKSRLFINIRSCQHNIILHCQTGPGSLLTPKPPHPTQRARPWLGYMVNNWLLADLFLIVLARALYYITIWNSGLFRQRLRWIFDLGLNKRLRLIKPINLILD